MARLYLVRHGEAESAWGGDDADPGLSQAGSRQAEAAALALLPLKPDSLVCSPMRRCRETAAPYERLIGRGSLIEPRVSEVPTPVDTADRRAWLQVNFPWRGGEARMWGSLDAPLRAWRHDLIEYAQSLREDTVIFSHFIAINVLVGSATGREETITCQPGYASITELAIEEGMLRLVRFGETMQSGEVL